ncbi:hypothetical protein RFI_20081 [Reticulomyxa filosa]|uniref:Kelch motif family protein n=1 Tax=Reticulomyxa filosa TaxID=46433 RepID=X6MVX1_RETFI|nr:hypothetical protein RFI_20081 [Reticulomyxa filosa]|eukprot:ETO17250.1 hypothetical protein RFI_20081 [Reticulomyxa filosa]
MPFETMSSLPVPLSQSQCVTHKHEILICGGYDNGNCYSYHVLKDQYKHICSYPKDVQLRGHCVVKRVSKSNENDITLLSFGGLYDKKHTLMLKYRSVWDEEDKELDIRNDSGINQWMPFTDSANKPICIGKREDDLWGVRGVIGGSENHLLFISYPPHHIDVFDLNQACYINRAKIPVERYISIMGHCLVSKTTDENQLADKKEDEMLLFCKNTGFSIRYEETCNRLHFYDVWVCRSLLAFHSYACVRIDDMLLFFGGCSTTTRTQVLKEVYKYSLLENKWMQFERTLPAPLFHSSAVLSVDKTSLFIVGGESAKKAVVSTQLKTYVAEWMKQPTEKEKKWILKEMMANNIKKETTDIERTNKEIQMMKNSFKIQNLKVE